MKKFLSVLLSLVLLLAVVPMGALAEEEVVTLTLLSDGNRPQNEFTDETWQYIKDNLGIDLQVTQAPENFTQQLALMVAGGDVPDIIWMNYDVYVTYAQEGLFTDLTDLVGNYPDLMEYVDTNGMGQYCWDRMTIDGAIYGVPTRCVNTGWTTRAWPCPPPLMS